MRNHKKFLVLTTVLCGILAFGPQSRAAGNDEYRNWNGDYGNRQAISFSQQDTAAITKYYRDFYRRNCISKRMGNMKGCMQPRQYKSYVVGKQLAKNIKAYNLPNDLEQKLRALQPRFEYIKVDGDILLVSTRTGRVMDAVVLDNIYRGSSVSSLLPIVNTYVVYFDPQSITLLPGERRILNQVAREMTRYNPSQVTITSYADSIMVPDSGQQLTDERVQLALLALQAFGMNIQDPNQVSPNNAGLVKQFSNIARRQEEAVSRELSKHNIPTQVVKSKLRGPLEKDFMSEDEFGVEETQMVVIDFRR